MSNANILMKSIVAFKIYVLLVFIGKLFQTKEHFTSFRIILL